MKFIYASLFCTMVSAMPITKDKRQLSGSGGSPTQAVREAVNTLSGATSLLNGIGLKEKRTGDEKVEARQLGDVTGLADQLVAGLLGRSSGGSGGLLEVLTLRRDDNGDVDKRQLDAVTGLLQSLLGGLLGGGDSSGPNVKRDVEVRKRQLDGVTDLVKSLLGGLLGSGNGGGLLEGLNLKRNELDELEKRQIDGTTALVQNLVGGLVGGQGGLLGSLNLEN